jgi:ABC-2 type transport system ATP-binding protein
MTEIAVSIQGLTQGYGKHAVLDNISLEIPRGQTVALLGRNGAGKTTLIRTLLGLLAPRAGAVSVLGLDPSTDAVEVRRRIGYLAEDQAMYGWITADEVARFLAPFYPTWDAALANDLFDRFGVPRRVRVKHFSKGQNVRLGLALALAHRPELVILDDPAIGLDPITRKQFNRDIIEWLQAEGRTVFYSSHLLYEVEAVADAVAILDRGRIVRCGPTEELQRDVRRVDVPLEGLMDCPQPAHLLDLRRGGAVASITVDRAADWLTELNHRGIQHTTESLSLDEIFEAFVIGQREGWENPSPRREPAVA